MTKYVHIPAETVGGPLDGLGQRPGADRGDPQISLLPFDTDGAVRAGVWECQPGGWPVAEREDTETCYILSGHAIVTDGSSGQRFEVRAGDVIVQPQGWSGRWDVIETIRKVWSIR
ncbi:MAG TPA: cupin domain-containing protein [Candidatus Nanopelagicales bacterium]|nr:cupin domain-containing protein [Candidatus Nanopelagicales bacterium]